MLCCAPSVMVRILVNWLPFTVLLQLAVYNPMRQYRIAYNLTISKEGRCLNNCTGPSHGTCNSDGVCECAVRRGGGDCSNWYSLLLAANAQ